MSRRLRRSSSLAAAALALAVEALAQTTENPAGGGTAERRGASPEAAATSTGGTAIVETAPGISSEPVAERAGRSSITGYGPSPAQDAVALDGSGTTALDRAFEGAAQDYDLLRDIDGGTRVRATEYGRASGAGLDLIPKSGGNEFAGDVFAVAAANSLRAGTQSTISPRGDVATSSRHAYGADLGGFFVKDKLWYFAALEQRRENSGFVVPTGPRTGRTSAASSARDHGAAKLTWNLARGQSLVGSFLDEPESDVGAIRDSARTLNGDPGTYLGTQRRRGRDFALRYEGLLGRRWVVDGDVSRHDERDAVAPGTAAGEGVEFRESSNGFFQTGGFGLIANEKLRRDSFGAAASYFTGSQEVRFGGEHEAKAFDAVDGLSGGQRVGIFPNPVDPARPIYRHFYWTTPDATAADAPLSGLDARPETEDSALHFQDNWQALPNLTLALGARWDRQQIFDGAGTRRLDLAKDLAPRLGFAWDPAARGRSKVYGSFGRYFESLSQNLVLRAFSPDRRAIVFNFDPVDTHPDPGAEADLGTSSGVLGGYAEPVDPGLRGQYFDESIVGYEREVREDLSIGVRGIYRSYGRVIADFLCATDGTYCLGNAGEGWMGRIYAQGSAYTLPAPKAKREFKGVEVDVQKRLSNNWQVTASYLWSKLEGNYDGEYAPFTNIGADPNISAAYDYYDFFTNGTDLSRITNTGPLSKDRRHQLEVSGLYVTPFQLSIGFFAYFQTGTPLTRYGFSDGYGRYEYFLTERGAEGRVPSSYEADLHLAYPIPAGPVTVNLLLDVFDLLNAQRPLLLDERWDFQQADNTSPTPTNPGYLKPILRTPPTSVRLGVRVSW